MVGLLNMPDQWPRFPDRKMDVFYHKILGVWSRIKKHSVQKCPQLITEKNKRLCSVYKSLEKPTSWSVPVSRKRNYMIMVTTTTKTMMMIMIVTTKTTTCPLQLHYTGITETLGPLDIPLGHNIDNAKRGSMFSNTFLFFSCCNAFSTNPALTQ